MIDWFLVFVVIYAAVLIYLALLGRKSNKGSASEYLMGGRSFGVFLGFLTLAATNFSTFSLIGLPDFYRTHGVATWVFVGIAITLMAIIALWFGLKLRDRIERDGKFISISNILRNAYSTNYAPWVFIVFIIVFLVPFVSIQIKGLSSLLAVVTPFGIGIFEWALLILVLMLIYSFVGGLRGIVYSDAVQGVVMFIVVWAFAILAITSFGGITPLIESVQSTKGALLSAPGPIGVLSIQFLLSFFIATILTPISQPQLLIRLGLLKSKKAFKNAILSYGIFGVLLMFPIVFIGLGGVASAAVGGPAFVGELILGVGPLLAAFAIVGIIAAAMSTADSQMFAVSSEFSTTYNKSEQLDKRAKFLSKAVMVVFALFALAVAVVSTEQLVLLARVGFAGSAILVPMIMIAVLNKGGGLGRAIPITTAILSILYLMSVFGLIATSIAGLRVDILLIILAFVISFGIFFKRKRT